MARPLLTNEILWMLEKFKNLKFQNRPLMPTLVVTLDQKRQRRTAGLLLGLQKSGVLKIDQQHIMLVEVAATSGESITGMFSININICPGKQNLLEFAQAMDNIIPDLRTVNKQRLNELLTSSKPKQQKFAEAIINECLAQGFCQEIAGFGVQIIGEPVLDRELPHILFRLLDQDDRFIGKIILDGRSGMLVADDEPADKAYRDPEEFRAAIWQILENYAPTASATG